MPAAGPSELVLDDSVLKLPADLHRTPPRRKREEVLSRHPLSFVWRHAIGTRRGRELQPRGQCTNVCPTRAELTALERVSVIPRTFMRAARPAGTRHIRATTSRIATRGGSWPVTRSGCPSNSSCWSANAAAAAAAACCRSRSSNSSSSISTKLARLLSTSSGCRLPAGVSCTHTCNHACAHMARAMAPFLARHFWWRHAYGARRARRACSACLHAYDPQ